jgi:hypothetical protein
LTRIAAAGKGLSLSGDGNGFGRSGLFLPAASHQVRSRRMGYWPGSDAVGGASSGHAQLPAQFTAAVSAMPLSRRTEIRFEVFASTITA